MHQLQPISDESSEIDTNTTDGLETSEPLGWKSARGAGVTADMERLREGVCSLRQDLQRRVVHFTGGPELQRRDAAQRDPEGMVISSNSYLSYIIYRST